MRGGERMRGDGSVCMTSRHEYKWCSGKKEALLLLLLLARPDQSINERHLLPSSSIMSPGGRGNERGFCFFTAQEETEKNREKLIHERMQSSIERKGLSSYSLSSDFRFHFPWPADSSVHAAVCLCSRKKKATLLSRRMQKFWPTFWSLAHIPLCPDALIWSGRGLSLFSMRGILSTIFADFISNQSLFRCFLYLNCCCCSRASVIAKRRGKRECDSNSKGITFAYQTEGKTSNIVPEIIKL